MTLDQFGRTLVLAPHPDDETLGCGATLLRLRAESSHPLFWVLMTRMTPEGGYDKAAIERREAEIEAVERLYAFDRRIQLPFAAATLDAQPIGEQIGALAAVFDELQPETLLLPFAGDAHSDHRRSFRIASACSKWFRRRYLRRLMCYEVLSETGFNLDPTGPVFAPNCYVPVDEALIERKVQIMATYSGEMADFPFPRSDATIRSLARLRGSECGAPAAEAFMLVRCVL